MSSCLLVVACGGSPAAPSTASAGSRTSSGSAAASTQNLVGAAVSTASSQLLSSATIGVNSPVQSPCPNGGSSTFTVGSVVPGNGSTLLLTSRIEFNNCQSPNVTIQGDPYLEMSGEFSPPVSSGSTSTASSSQHMTGGLRFTANGEQGRAQFDCSYAVTVQLSGGVPQVSSSSRGTVTWEQPLGSAPVVQSCGPE